MTISITNLLPTSPRDAASARGSRGADQARDRFAGLLAHAHATATHARPPHTPRDGTSELDGGHATRDDRETTGADDDETKARKAAAARAARAAANTVVQAVGALDPELQARLARVMDRMQTETGHTVTVEETYRSQSRQDALFAQGRTTDGPVVTWTQNSKHSQGRAVDLLLDGGTAGADAYATLQRIAREEGLRTLGAIDPGHLELPGSGVANATTLKPAAPADASGPGQASVARLAEVASVAQPATVARVATVARSDTSANAGTAPRLDAQAAQVAQSAQAKDSSEKSGSSSDDRGSSSGSQGDQRGGYGSLAPTFTLRDFNPVTASAATGGSTAAQRTEHVRDAIDNAPARPLSQITMNVDAGNGATDRIHVALRGATLNTTIDVSDARAAQTMTARSDELVRALNRDGMEVESMRVRAMASTAAPIAAPAAQSGSDSSTNSRFDRGNPWQQQERQQSQSDRRQPRDQRRGDRQ